VSGKVVDLAFIEVQGVAQDGRLNYTVCRQCGWLSNSPGDPYKQIKQHVLSGDCRPSVAYAVRRLLTFPVPMWLMLLSAVLIGIATKVMQ